jgi:hypothetical protein
MEARRVTKVKKRRAAIYTLLRQKPIYAILNAFIYLFSQPRRKRPSMKTGIRIINPLREARDCKSRTAKRVRGVEPQRH